MGSSAQALEFDYLGQPWFMMGATLAKISICLFFLRLVGTTRQWRVLLCVQIFLMAVVNLAFAMTTNLQCMPLKKLWKPAVPGSCWDPRVQKNIGYTQGSELSCLSRWLRLRSMLTSGCQHSMCFGGSSLPWSPSSSSGTWT